MKYNVPVRWQAVQLVTVEATSKKKAINKALEVAEERLVDADSIVYDCPEVMEDEVMEAKDGG